ncbi:MAG: carboxypeptidase-like regulatory domain-containing protein [Bacteroidota bacterium]
MHRFLLLVWLSLTFCPSLSGQAIPILKNKRQISCTKALEILEDQYKVTFSYEVTLLRNRKTSPSFIGPDLTTSLQKILSPHQLTFKELADNFVIISPLEKAGNQLFQKSLISGRIIDETSGEVVSYAAIQLLGTKDGVYTDEYGHFRMVVPSSKEDSLLIRRMGFTPRKIAVASFSDSVRKVVSLSPAPSTLEDVVITKEKIPPITLGGEKGEITLIPREFTAVPGWGEPDILRSAQQLPGINSISESAGEIHIRGGTPDQNLLSWDHIPIYHLSHFFGMYSPFNPYISQKVEVYRGDYGVEFGGRIAGVIDITGRPDTLGLVKAGIGANLLHAHGYVEVPIAKKAVLLLSVRKSYTDWLESGFYRRLFDRVFQEGNLRQQKYDQQQSQNEPGYQVEFNPIFNFEDLNGKWVFFPTENDKFSISFYQGQDRLNTDYTEGTPDTVWWQSSTDVSLKNWGISMNLEHIWNDQNTTILRMVHSNYRNDQNFLDESLLAREERYTQDQYSSMIEDKLTFMHTSELSSQHTLTAGIDYSYNQVEYDSRYFWPDGSWVYSDTTINEVISPYLQHELRWKKWYVKSGIRFNHIGSLGENFWEPRISASYFPMPSLRLKLSAGRFIQYNYQVIDYNEISVGEGVWVTAYQGEEDDLPVVTSRHLSASALWSQDDWQVEVSAYHRKVNNTMAAFIKLVEEFREVQEDTELSRGTGDLRGIDAWIKKKWGKYQSWFSYSLGQVTYNFPDIEEVSGNVPAPHDIRHIGSWTHLYSSKNWDFSAQLSFSSGRPYTPLVIGRETADPNRAIPYSLENLAEEPEQAFENHNGIYREASGFFSARLPGTSRVDVAANYTALIGKVRPLKAKFGVSVFNLFNQENYFGVNYTVEDNEDDILPRIRENRKSMLGFTPNVFMRLEW